MLNFLWNITVNLYVAYRMHSLDPFQLGAFAGSCNSYKPLFAYFIRFGSNYAYPLVFIANALYMIPNGPRFVHILDLPAFRKVYQNDRQAKIIFFGAMVVTNLFYGTVLFSKFIDYQHYDWPTTAQLFTFFTIYIIVHYNQSLFFTVHYFQYAMYRRLRQISQQLRSPLTSMVDEEAALELIQGLAAISCALTSLLSWPLISFILLNGLNIILSGSLLMVCPPNYGIVQSSILNILYTLYLVKLNRRILTTVALIGKRLRAKYEGRARQPQTEQVISHWLRIHELDCCFGHFRVNIYHLGALDGLMYCHAAFFILHYVVIFTQTNLIN